MAQYRMQKMYAIAVLAMASVWQSSFAAQPLINKQFRLSSIHVTSWGPVYLYPDASTAANNNSGCNPDGIAISRTKPNFNELYSLAMAAMLAGKTLVIDSGDFNGAGVNPCFEYGRATTNSIRMLN